MREGPIIFSYSRKNERFALDLATHLREAGVTNWINQIDIPGGTTGTLQIERALQSGKGLAHI